MVHPKGGGPSLQFGLANNHYNRCSWNQIFFLRAGNELRLHDFYGLMDTLVYY
jgi:hypothetical protein